VTSAAREAALVVVDESLAAAGSAWSSSILRGSLDLEAAYRTLALLCFLEDGDVDGFHHHMHLAACTRLRLLHCVERGMKCPPHLLCVTYDGAIHEALCSGEGRVATSLAEHPLTREPAPGHEADRAAFATAMRQIILGRIEEAKAPLLRFEQKRGPSMDGQSLLLQGIVKSDEARFNGALRMLADARARAVLPGEARLSAVVLAFARLGQRIGLAVTVADPAIPHELLGEAESPYPDPARVLPPIPAEIIEKG
jgi:hypothetical protein